MIRVGIVLGGNLIGWKLKAGNCARVGNVSIFYFGPYALRSNEVKAPRSNGITRHIEHRHSERVLRPQVILIKLFFIQTEEDQVLPCKKTNKNKKILSKKKENHAYRKILPT